MEVKKCSKCEEFLIIESFRKNKRYKGGHVTWCKPCEKEYHKNHRSLNKKKNSDYQKAYAKKNAKKIATRKAKYYQEKKEIIDAKNKAWAAENPEKRKLHRDAYSTKNPDAKSSYYRENKNKFAASTRKRQAAKIKRTPSWANKQLIDAFYLEAKRLEELTGIKFHVDHIIPLQGELVSGLHVETNLQLLPAHENLGKSNNFDPELFTV